jgi:hypothetical protein
VIRLITSISLAAWFILAVMMWYAPREQKSQVEIGVSTFYGLSPETCNCGCDWDGKDPTEMKQLTNPPEKRP